MGGFNGSNAVNDGDRYSPASDTWATVSVTGAPAGRYQDTAVWTGSEMIVWGGTNAAILFNNTFTYTPGRMMYLYQRP